MRRRSFSRNSVIEVELFPFLSILACTIGTLILLIAVLTLTKSFNKQQEVVILAEIRGKVNQTKTPRYIECHQDGIILYPSQTFVSKNKINTPTSAFNKLLIQVKKNRSKEYLIVAIRPDGIEIFQKVRQLIEKQGIDLGYEPIDPGWKLKALQN